MPSPFLSTRAPLLWLLCPLIAGLGTAKLLAPPALGLWPLLTVAAIAAPASVWAARTDRSGLWSAILVAVGALTGFALLHLRHPRLHHWETHPPREITVTLKIDTIHPGAHGGRSVSGLARITAATEKERELAGQMVHFSAIRRISVPPHPGAECQARGVLEPLPRDGRTGFDDYLANLGVRHRLARAQLIRETAPPDRLHRLLTRTRTRVERILNRGLERHPGIAALYRAMLLGEKAALSTEQEEAFVHSGTFHVFSVSGLHVGIIAVALRLAFRAARVPARLGAGLTLGFLWLYVQVTGAGAPSVRAFIMVAFLLTSESFRLAGNALSALTAAALFTLLLDPLQLFNTGFQMSYTVVTALLLLGGPLAERWLRHWRPYALRPRPDWRWWHETVDWLGRKVITASAGCWAAFLGSMASGIGYFGILSPGSLPANLVILPLSTLAIVAGLLSLVAGLASLPAWSALFNAAAALLIIAAEWLLQKITPLPGIYFPASFRADWLPATAAAAMTGVLLAGASVRWAPRYGGFWPPVVLLGLLLIFGVKFGPG